jgi:hypothetical protein
MLPTNTTPDKSQCSSLDSELPQYTIVLVENGRTAKEALWYSTHRPGLCLTCDCYDPVLSYKGCTLVGVPP